MFVLCQSTPHSNHPSFIFFQIQAALPCVPCVLYALFIHFSSGNSWSGYKTAHVSKWTENLSTRALVKRTVHRGSTSTYGAVSLLNTGSIVIRSRAGDLKCASHLHLLALVLPPPHAFTWPSQLPLRACLILADCSAFSVELSELAVSLQDVCTAQSCPQVLLR